MKVKIEKDDFSTRNITFETCPVCQRPNVKVEHALHGLDNRRVHLWHCPECGDSLAYVGYDCEYCPAVAA